MDRYLVFFCVVAMSLTTGSLSPAANESTEKPKIYLEKRVIAEMAGEQIKFFEVYRVEKGDALWKIFIDKLGGRKEEFGMFLNAFKRANPAILNPSKIKQGEKVKLPIGVGSLGKKERLDKLKEKGKIYEHEVVSGDILWNIASKDFRSTRELLDYVDEVKKLNPFLRNPDRIYPGQKLYLPRYSYFAEDEDETEKRIAMKTGVVDEGDEVAGETDVTVLEPKAEGDIDSQESEPRQIHEMEEKEMIKGEGLVRDRPHSKKDERGEFQSALPEKVLEKEEGEKGFEDRGAVTSVGDTAHTPSDSAGKPLAYRGLIGDILSTLGEKLILSGEMYVPLDGGGELLLNMENYPLVRFSNGKNLILDLGGTIPVEVERVVRAKWDGYSIMRLAGDEEFASFVETLLRRANYHSVKEGNATQLVIGEKVSLSLESDLIVLKDGDSLLRGEVYAIKRSHTSVISERLSNIYAYCLKAGIVVIPYFVDRTINDGYVISYNSESNEGSADREKVPSSMIDGVKYILDTVGIRSEKSHKISIKGPQGAFTLTIKPDLVFWIDDRPHVFDPERFTEPIRKLLEKGGYRIVRVRKNQSYASIIPEILKLSGKTYKSFDDEIIAGGEHRGYILKASGILLGKEESGNENNFLFVKGEVDLGMRELFSHQIGIRIVTY